MEKGAFKNIDFLNILYNSQDETELLNAVKKLNDSQEPEVSEAMLVLLERTTYHAVRNRIALWFEDKENQRAYDIIVKLLSSNKTQKNRGTLLYSLRNKDNTSIISLLVDLAIKGNYEVNAEACSLLNEIDTEIPEDLWLESKTKIEKAIPASDGQKRKNLKTLLSFFKEDD